MHHLGPGRRGLFHRLGGVDVTALTARDVALFTLALLAGSGLSIGLSVWF